MIYRQGQSIGASRCPMSPNRWDPAKQPGVLWDDFRLLSQPAMVMQRSTECSAEEAVS